MRERIAYEARALNRDPRISALINTAFSAQAYDSWYISYNVLEERFFTLYSIEAISMELYNVLAAALDAVYNQ